MRATKRILQMILVAQCMFSLVGCAQKEQKQFVQDFNNATSMEFNIPYIDQSKVLVGYDLTTNTAIEKQLIDTVLSQAVPKQSDGSYLMTNTTLVGALCNPNNNLGYFINPSVTQAASTLTTDNVEKMNSAIQTYISGAFVGKNLGDDTVTQQLSQKYIVANLIFKVLPSRDYQDTAINPNGTTITRAQAMIALMNAFYGTGTIPEDYPDKVDTSAIDAAIQTAVSNGLLTENTVPHRFLTDNNKALAWMDQFCYLKVADGEMGANLLFKEITYGEFEYMLSNLMIREGLIQESDIQRDKTSIDKKLTGDYTVKSVAEIVEKANKSSKMQSNVIPGKSLQLLRALYTSGASKTVDAELYNVYNSMATLGINKKTSEIYDTVTVNNFYSELLNLANFVTGNAKSWTDYVWVDPNPTPAPTPEPEPEYLDFDKAMASWLVGNSIQTPSSLGLVDAEATEDDIATIQNDLMAIYNGESQLEKITEQTHKDLTITGVNLQSEQYEQMFQYLQSKGFTQDNLADYCKSPFLSRYSEWLNTQLSQSETEQIDGEATDTDSVSESDSGEEASDMTDEQSETPVETPKPSTSNG